jgi:hypothetical protein
MFIFGYINNTHKTLLYSNFKYFFLGWVIAVPSLLLLKIYKYLRSTFLNSGHGADDASINFISWIKYLFNDYFAFPSFFVFLITIALLAIVITILTDFKTPFLVAKQRCKTPSPRPSAIGLDDVLRALLDQRESFAALKITLLIGLLFILPIMFFT